MRRLLRYLIIRKKLLLIAFTMILIGSFLDLIGPILLKVALDEYILKGKTDGLLTIGFFYILVFIFSGITAFLRIWLLSVVGHSALYELRKDAFDHLQTLGMDYFDDEATGEIMARLTNDIDRLEPILSGEVLFALSSVVMIVAMFGVMLSLSPILTLIFLLVIPLIIISAYLQRNIVRPRWRKWRDIQGEVTTSMTENISGVRISQSFARRENNVSEFDELNWKFYQAEMSAIKAEALIWPSYGLWGALATVLILYLGGSMVLNEEAGITAGVLVLFVSYQFRLLQPITILSGIYSQLQTAFASMERIVMLQDRPSSIQESSEAATLECTEGEVEFQNVNFRYNSTTEPVLDNFSLKIEAGETIAIVGETGAGKTTLANLIPRFYDIQGGSVLIDNQDIREVSLSSLRQNIGVVLQEPFLFSESIRKNLCYGREASDDELQQVLRLVGAEFVYNLPKGLGTIVGERGGRLSMGQRQLISFARALIANPRILVLDEATSSIDPQAELRIQRALSKILKNRTSIIIAHRLSTVRAADRIIVLDGGKIVEEGSYEGLLDQKGRFYELHQLQFWNSNSQSPS
jgi:ATP-binding cassette subfamily B multidrug efflux pump